MEKFNVYFCTKCIVLFIYARTQLVTVQGYVDVQYYRASVLTHTCTHTYMLVHTITIISISYHQIVSTVSLYGNFGYEYHIYCIRNNIISLEQTTYKITDKQILGV